MRRPTADAIWSAITWLECYDGDGGDSLKNVKQVITWLTALAQTEEAQSAALSTLIQTRPDLPQAELRRLARRIAAQALRALPDPSPPRKPHHMSITAFWAAAERRARADREAIVRLAAACRRHHQRQARVVVAPLGASVRCAA